MIPWYFLWSFFIFHGQFSLWIPHSCAMPVLKHLCRHRGQESNLRQSYGWEKYLRVKSFSAPRLFCFGNKEEFEQCLLSRPSELFQLGENGAKIEWSLTQRVKAKKWMQRFSTSNQGNNIFRVKSVINPQIHCVLKCFGRILSGNGLNYPTRYGWKCWYPKETKNKNCWCFPKQINFCNFPKNANDGSILLLYKALNNQSVLSLKFPSSWWIIIEHSPLKLSKSIFQTNSSRIRRTVLKKTSQNLIPENKYISLSLFFTHHILSQFLLLIASFIIINQYKRLKYTQFSLGWTLREVLNKTIEDGDITVYFWIIKVHTPKWNSPSLIIKDLGSSNYFGSLNSILLTFIWNYL